MKPTIYNQLTGACIVHFKDRNYSLDPWIHLQDILYSCGGNGVAKTQS